MTRGLPVALLALAAFALGACSPPVRQGAWVVRHALRSPQGVARVCGAARAAGLDTLLVQVRGRGDAYYRSDLAPRAEDLDGAAADFDPLAAVLREAGPAEVHAWMNVYFLWEEYRAPRSPLHPAAARPESILRDAQGRSVAEYGPADRALGWIEGIYADPADPEYRAAFAALAAEVVSRYRVAGVHLDFVRYPGPGYGQGGPLGAYFRDAWGLDPRWLPEGSRTPDLPRWLAGELPAAEQVLATYGLLWAELRASRVTALVRAVREAVDRVRPGVELSAAVFPDPADAYLNKGQDWRTWAAEGLVDALHPMAYFGPGDRVEAQLRAVSAAVRAAAPGVRLWAGLGSFLKEPGAVREEARTAAALGYDGICLFDAGSAMDTPHGLGAFVLSERARPAADAPAAGAPLLRPGARGGQFLAAVAERAWDPARPWPADASARLDERWEELEAAGPQVAGVIEGLQGASAPVPAWADLSGIFRYVHPLDPPRRRQEQRQVLEDARVRVAAGASFQEVAREVSQGGTRKQGGVLARRYLRRGNPADDAVWDLGPGDLSSIVEVENGFWLYRMEARGAEADVNWDQVPWDVRRQLFRERLGRALADTAAAPVRPQRRM